MIYHVSHRTEYSYDVPASLCYNEARLLPRSFELPLLRQTCHERRVTVEPAQQDQRERQDFFGNHVLYFAIPQPHQQMVITATSRIEIEPTPGLAQAIRWGQVESQTWETAAAQLKNSPNAKTLLARQFVMTSPMVAVFPALAEFAAPSFAAGRPLLTAACDLMTRIYDMLEFVPGVTTITTPLAEVLAERRGVCQDYAHLMVGCLRAQGLAARYVSGYIETLPPPGQEKLVGVDASHAWCSLFVPELGWIDFDPTNNLIPEAQHLTLGWGRDFSDVTPLKGVFLSTGRHRLHVAVDVTRMELDNEAYTST